MNPAGHECKKCHVAMVYGVALREGYTTGVPDFDRRGGDGQTMFPSGQSNMVTVAKCPKCGYSVTV